MFVATSSNSNTNHPSSYIVAANTTPAPPPTTTVNAGLDATTTATSNATPQTLSDIKLICAQRKKRSKRHIYLTFVESRPLSSPTEQPCIEVTRKSSSSSQPSTYSLNECMSFEYFDAVKNDFQAFIYAYFESYTISIFFSEDNYDKKTLIIKHLEYMCQSKAEKSAEINNNTSQDVTQSQSSTIPQSPSQQSPPILPCPSITEHILHTFDIALIPYGPIIHRDHVLIGPARLYFTTTDLYISSINCNRTDLKVTITNQCPSKDKAILCIPYFTIKNYGNRSNIFLVELGKSNYGNGEIHMKCHSSSLASTIHLLVSPVIEERPLILSSAFQNKLLTHKRMEKSKNIHPPIQLTSETTTQSILEPTATLTKRKSIETSPADPRAATAAAPNDLKSRLVVGFFRTLTKNVSHLRRSATFHNNNSTNTKTVNNNNIDQPSAIDPNLSKTKYVGFMDDKKLQNDQHHIHLPDNSQKKADSISNASSNLTRQTCETTLTVSTLKQESASGTYIEMGPTSQKSTQNQQEETEDEASIQETTATAEIGINTMITLSPHVRSAIIVGNTVHLIADERTVFPIGQRSFTSPASALQPFKTQLNGPTVSNNYAASADLITSSQNSSSSLHQANSGSNSQQSLLLSYGIVTFNNTDLIPSDQTERATSPPSDGSTLDRRLNSDISLMSTQQQQQQQQSQGPIVHSIDSVLSSSSAHIFRTLSVSTNNIGDTTSGQIIFIDDHLNDQTTTYLLGPPPIVSDETISTNLSRLSSFNLTAPISRPVLSHIDEEKTSPNDPYALVEPLSHENLHPASDSSTTLTAPLPVSEKSINYVDILLPNHSNNNENSESNDQQQMLCSDDVNDENNDFQEQEREINDLSTKLYTDIDFHQTQRRDRIVQSAARAKMDDQTPPFVL